MEDYRAQLQKQIDKKEQELYSLKRKLFKLDQRAKHEQYMRRRYPAVEEAYKQYQMMLKLVKNNKDNK
tara:strand:- start:431 stop:634 length:204 start_codon:yes stop_codon:yes gene_type:complete